MDKVRWGVLSTAKIGIEKVIPAMQKSKYCHVTAIASRVVEKAQSAAARLSVEKAYGSYDDLLADPSIDAVYIPLPNHQHVPWSMRAIKAQKHVLCEKPIGLTSTEAEQLFRLSKEKPALKVMEAFMYRFHPQWIKARDLVEGGGIGELQTIQSFFSYFNVDPENIRNKAEIGGGGLMDIGCYCISLSRFIFGTEPLRVMGVVQLDDRFKTDKLSSGVLDFGRGTSVFTCSTQLAPYQRVNIVGTEGRVELEIPFNAPPNKPCLLWHQTKRGIEEIFFDVCDQYTEQADAFSLSIINGSKVPTDFEDALSNMRVIEKIFKSAETGRWVE